MPTKTSTLRNGKSVEPSVNNARKTAGAPVAAGATLRVAR